MLEPSERCGGSGRTAFPIAGAKAADDAERAERRDEAHGTPKPYTEAETMDTARRELNIRAGLTRWTNAAERCRSGRRQPVARRAERIIGQRSGREIGSETMTTAKLRAGTRPGQQAEPKDNGAAESGSHDHGCSRAEEQSVTAAQDKKQQIHLSIGRQPAERALTRTRTGSSRDTAQREDISSQDQEDEEQQRQREESREAATYTCHRGGRERVTTKKYFFLPLSGQAFIFKFGRRYPAPKKR